jgi:putative SOS response-associated peptidase YedK
MCARYTLKANPLELQEEFSLQDTPTLAPRYNIAPTQEAPIITAVQPQLLTPARWGLIPSWAKDVSISTHTLNARAETIATKGVFKDSFAHRRCLVPVDGFYEWKHVGKMKQPLHITLQSHRPFSLAGLWDTWKTPDGVDLVTFTIVTTTSNAAMSAVHDRMPVFIAPEDRHRWLTDDASASALLEPWKGEALELREVNPIVNKASVDDPRCLEPARTVQLPLL